MSIIERMNEACGRIAARFASGDEVAELEHFDEDQLLAMLADASDVRKAIDLLVAAGASLVATRSDRALGQSGLAQRKGHRTPAALVQQITGQGRSEIIRVTQAGADLRDAATRRTPAVDTVDPAAGEPIPWHAPLTDALAAGTIAHAQYDAIRRALGEPPVERYPELDPDFLPGAWREASIVLIREAAESALEDLRNAARIARDRLDPIGVTLRFDERYENRSFRVWIDEAGQHNARIRFDDEAAAWVQAILSAALRPRRGPRFVPSGAVGAVGIDDDSGAADTAPDAATADDRSNEQLQYDTLMAILRTGAAADPDQAFGDRQPGIRIVVTREGVEGRDAFGRVRGTGHLEDGGQSLPPAVIDKYLCDAGSTTISLDPFGNPLDVGRERRLFTEKQRVALRIRDGGCLWPGCNAPPSRCEAHHSEHWVAHGGRTDIDLGVLLCTFHHLRLHNQGWKITRSDGGFWLHPPPDQVTGQRTPPIKLVTKSPRRFSAA